MENKKYFVSLGAGIHQLPLIRAAKNQGFKVIAVDRNIQAPGFEFSDVQVHANIMKPYKIIRILGEQLMLDSIAGVASRSYGMANFSAAIIAEHFNTPHLSSEKLKLFRNKRKLKELLKKNKIQCPKIYSWKTKKSKESLFKTRKNIIIRPAVGSHGKQGIKIIKGKAEIEKFLVKNPDDRGTILVEDVIAGQEYTVLGYVEKSQYKPVSITDKIVSSRKPLFAELIHKFPPTLSREIREEINSIMQRMVDALELNNTALVAEFIVPSRGKIPYLIECNPEVGGEYLADYLILTVYGDGFFEKIVSLHCLDHETRRKPFPGNKAKRSVIIRFIEQKNGILEKLELPDIDKKYSNIIFHRLLKCPGMKTEYKNGNLDRLAVFGLQGHLKESDKILKESEAILTEANITYKKL
jgi:biotin carboxylase